MDDQAGAQLESASSQSPSEVAGNQEACALPAPAAVPAESLMAPPPAKQAQVQNPTPAGSKGELKVLADLLFSQWALF